MVNNWPQLYAGSVVDVSDVAEEIGKVQGGYYEISKIVANDGQKWIGVPWSIGGGLLTNRKSWFEEVGYGDGKFPETWDEYRAVGKKLKAQGGIVKLTVSREKNIKRSRRSHCSDRVVPLVGRLGSEDPQRGA